MFPPRERGKAQNIKRVNTSSQYKRARTNIGETEVARVTCFAGACYGKNSCLGMVNLFEKGIWNHHMTTQPPGYTKASFGIFAWIM